MEEKRDMCEVVENGFQIYSPLKMEDPIIKQFQFFFGHHRVIPIVLFFDSFFSFIFFYQKDQVILVSKKKKDQVIPIYSLILFFSFILFYQIFISFIRSSILWFKNFVFRFFRQKDIIFLDFPQFTDIWLG